MLLYVNTLPQENIKKDGTLFFTVLIGVSKEALAAKTGKPARELANVRLSMEIFPEKVSMYTEMFKATETAGKKLVIECEDFNVSPLKDNTFLKNGEIVNGLKASVWPAKGWKLDVKNKTTKVEMSDELRKLMGEID